MFYSLQSHTCLQRTNLMALHWKRYATVLEKVKYNILRRYTISTSILKVIYCMVAICLILQAVLLLHRSIVRGILGNLLEEDVNGKLMVVYNAEDTLFTTVQGHFSDFQAGVGAIIYGLHHGAAAVQLNYHTNYLYKDQNYNDNYWLNYYEHDTMILREDIKPPYEQVHFSSWVSRFGRIGSFTPEVIGRSRDRTVPYPLKPYYSIEYIHEIVSRYIKPKQHVTNAVDDFIRHHWPNTTDRLVIGVHYRGTDKIDQYPYSHPPHEQYDFHIKQVIDLYSQKDQPIHVFIATDSIDFIQWAEQNWAYVNHHNITLSFLPDSPRLFNNQTSAGHGTHHSNQFTNYQKGLTAIMDCMLLARANYIIKNRSSLSDVSLWLAGSKVNYSMILGAQDPVFSTDTRIVQMCHNNQASNQQSCLTGH